MRLLSQKQNKLAWLETLDLKIGGATSSALKLSNKKSRCILLLTYSLRTFVSKATYYRHLSNHVEQQQQTIQSQIGSEDAIALHWLDNYSKFYKASGMYTDKHLVQNALWTAHGVKILPSQVSLQWSYTADGSTTISALPHLVHCQQILVTLVFCQAFALSLTVNIKTLSLSNVMWEEFL